MQLDVHQKKKEKEYEERWKSWATRTLLFRCCCVCGSISGTLLADTHSTRNELRTEELTQRCYCYGGGGGERNERGRDEESKQRVEQKVTHTHTHTKRRKERVCVFVCAITTVKQNRERVLDFLFYYYQSHGGLQYSER